MTAERFVVVIAIPLEVELVALIEAVDDRLEIRYQPDLLPPLGFPSDHHGIQSFRRTLEHEGRWRAMVGDAEVLFGLPGDSPERLADVVRANPRLRWVQATSGGFGEHVRLPA